MGRSVAVLLDGGHVRVQAKKAGHTYDPDYIEKIALACIVKDEQIHRVLYYDCAPYNGAAILPVSGQPKTYTASDKWLHAKADENVRLSCSVRQGRRRAAEAFQGARCG
jgi:hypothetical protein